jgi:hypothetical protein
MTTEMVCFDVFARPATETMLDTHCEKDVVEAGDGGLDVRLEPIKVKVVRRTATRLVHRSDCWFRKYVTLPAQSTFVSTGGWSHVVVAVQQSRVWLGELPRHPLYDEAKLESRVTTEE